MSLITEKSNVRVQWYDKQENWSKEREKDVIAYVKNKYKTNNAKVEFHATNKLSIGITNLDDKDIINLNAPETQEKIILGWLKDNNVDIKLEDIIRLNKRVESFLPDFTEVKDNKWKLKKLSFENFLSYGKKTTIDFEKLQGITLIQGDNFVGKTTIIESLLFLLYNKTTKTKINDDVINKFIDVDFARVEGEIEIEGIDYKIEREVIRKWKKDKSDYKTSTNLRFLSLDENKEWIESDKEEDRNATERKIKENIGDIREFLMTIMVTGDDIFSIIKALPTERGTLLSKFLGLEIFERKETQAKELYSEWMKKSKINRYTSSDLQSEIDTSNETIIINNTLITTLQIELDKILKLKEGFVKQKEEYLTYLNKDIDISMVNLDESHFLSKINNINQQIKDKEGEIKTIKIVPLKEEFNQKLYDEYISKEKELDRKIILLENDIKKIKQDINNLKNGEKCSSCGQSLKDVDHSAEIEEKTKKGIASSALLKTYEAELGDLKPLIVELEEIHDKYILNENLELKRDKFEVEVERFKMSLTQEQTKLEKFNADKEKIKVNKDLEEKIRLKGIDILEQSNFETAKKREIQTIENNNTSNTIKIEENKELIETIKKEEHISKIFLTYINMVGKNGISKTIIKNSVPALNLELQRLLNDSAEFTVEIDVNIKNNEVEFWMIDNLTQKRALLISGSGYEKTVASLALRFVFTKINTLPKPSLFFNDEIFSTVSVTRLELIKIFIDKVAESIDNIFIITHNELVKEWADNILTVTKENNISTVNF